MLMIVNFTFSAHDELGTCRTSLVSLGYLCMSKICWNVKSFPKSSFTRVTACFFGGIMVQNLVMAHWLNLLLP